MSEADEIASKLPKGATIIALCIEGAMTDSDSLAARIMLLKEICRSF